MKFHLCAFIVAVLMVGLIIPVRAAQGGPALSAEPDPMTGHRQVNYLTSGDVVLIKATNLSQQTVSGTIRITSQSTGYDSGVQPLTWSSDGSYLFFHWTTFGLSVASDYNAEATLNTSSGGSQTVSLSLSLVLNLVVRTNITSATDLFLPYRRLGLYVQRTYHSDPLYQPYPGAFGVGWTPNYAMSLHQYPDGLVSVTTPDGSAVYFQSLPDGSYERSSGVFWQLTKMSNGQFSVQDKQGNRAIFNTSGVLTAMQDPQGFQLTFVYDSQGNLIGVQDAAGQSLT
ncbi:MAG TPA: DUF6531 domain-containing protein, partial [Chthonomonadaceae bacterium]|nr:DUF6531 domain-containing protein [Chthonomonadaceae bacterium]